MIPITEQMEFWPQEKKASRSINSPAQISFQGVETVKVKRKEFRISLGHSQDFDTVELVATNNAGTSVEVVFYTEPNGIPELKESA